MGNYLNAGTAKGNVSGFSLDSLEELKKVEAFSEKQFSLLNFLCQTLEQKCPSAFQIVDDLEHCTPASQAPPVEDLKNKEQDLGKSLDEVQKVTPAEAD